MHFVGRAARLDQRIGHPLDTPIGRATCHPKPRPCDADLVDPKKADEWRKWRYMSCDPRASETHPMLWERELENKREPRY